MKAITRLFTRFLDDFQRLDFTRRAQDAISKTMAVQDFIMLATTGQKTDSLRVLWGFILERGAGKCGKENSLVYQPKPSTIVLRKPPWFSAGKRTCFTSRRFSTSLDFLIITSRHIVLYFKIDLGPAGCRGAAGNERETNAYARVSQTWPKKTPAICRRPRRSLASSRRNCVALHVK